MNKTLLAIKIYRLCNFNNTREALFNSVSRSPRDIEAVLRVNEIFSLEYAEFCAIFNVKNNWGRRMRLDTRILKNPLSGFDFKIAKEFIGKSGYFGSSIEDFFKLDKLKHGELLRIDEYNGDFYYGDYIGEYCAYFLPDEYVNHVKPIEDDITLSKLLSKLEVFFNHRVVIYDKSNDIVFDSDNLGEFGVFEFWKLLEEKVCRFSDVTRNYKRTIYIFMSY